MNYSKALRILRAAKGISQQDLAEKAKLSKSLLSKIEAGIRPLTKINQDKITQAIGVPNKLLDILAIDPSDNKNSQIDISLIGKALLSISDEINNLDEK